LADGRFRRDLYYRLCGHRVHLPPLRDRPTDIPLLLAHFTAMAAAQLGLSAPRVPPAVIDLCMPYPFPGNVRELQGLVQDALSRSGGRTLEVESFRALQAAPALPVAQLTFPARLPQIQEVVDQLVAEALRRSQGNRAAAARLLGISRQAMSQRLRHRDGNRS
jgi:DNA-binding NtrC family response regulator